MTKKVLHIISSKIWRGGEQQVNFLFNADNKDFEHYLFCVKDSVLEKRNQHKKDKIITYKKHFGFDIFGALKLKKFCIKNKIDLIHLHDSHAINTYIIADLYGMHVPCIVHRHVSFDINNKWKYNHKKIHKIICVNDVIKQKLSKFINEKKLVTIQPAIEVKKFTNHKTENINYLKQTLNLNNETKIIGIVAALEKEKNIEEFIAIAKKMIAKNNNYHFIIVGDGSLKTKFITEIAAQKSNLHLLGFRDDIEKIIPSFDVFLFTSKNEGFPLVILEAMASKVPIICNNFTTVNEIIEHEKTGFIYKNIDDAVSQIEKLLTTNDLQLTTIKNAFNFVQQFNIKEMKIKIEEVYNTVLND